MSRRLLPKAYAALLNYLALSPLYLLPGSVLLPGKLWIAAALPVPALLLTGWAGLRSAKRRAAALTLAMALTAAGCAALFFTIEPLGMLLFLPCAVTMLTFMPAMARPAHQEWTPKHLTAGVVLHIAAQFLKGIDVFQSAAAPLSWLFVVYLIAFLFSFNRNMLADTGPSESKALLFQNRKLLTVFCGLALLLANVGAVGSAIRAAISWIMQAVVNAVTWLLSFMRPTETAGDGGQMDLSQLTGLEEASEPSLFSRIVEIALIVLGVLIAAAALFFLIRYLNKLLRRAFAALRERFKLYRQRIAADYVDQSETLLDWGEIKKTAADRFRRAKQRLMPTPWEKLSPAHAVRRVYRLLLRRADAPDPARTAREMLTSGALRLPEDAAAPAAALYDRARYSTHPIARQEADDLRRRAGV
ncbi:MAG: DUF4129 domain-containing protein [Clostridiales bacterium]|nr:DUF4129 domain-containing protein [Clostridiales bacterium]